jgi:hypothetical protein
VNGDAAPRLDAPGRNPGPILLDAAGLVAALAYGTLAILSREPAHVGLVPYFLLTGTAWAAALAAYCLLRAAEPFPWRRMLAWALVFRAAGLAGEPLLEDDHFRYLWDGRTFAVTGNPYASRPGDHFADRDLPPAFEQVLSGINHPDVPTIYGPTCQYAFLASYLAAPARLWPLKVILLGADLVLLALLLRLARPRDVLLYAWCPLLVKEVAFTAHPDILGIALAVLALHLRREQRPAAAAVLGLAIGAKVFAVLLAPFILLGAPPRAWVACTLVLLALYLPFGLSGSGAELAGTAAFLREWEFNSLAHAALAAGLGALAAKVLGALLYLIFYAAYLRRWLQGVRWVGKPRPLPRGDWILGVFLLLAPVVNPWYLLWLLPFVALRPSAWGAAALIAVDLSYIHGQHLADPGLAPYEHPAWVRPLEVLLLLCGFALDLRRRRANAPEGDVVG